MAVNTKILSTFVLFLHVVNTELGSVTSILISPDMIKYNLHCGTQEVYCEWPLQYCFDNEVCRYCSTDVCHNPPDQCKYMCEYFKLQDPSYKGKS